MDALCLGFLYFGNNLRSIKRGFGYFLQIKRSFKDGFGVCSIRVFLNFHWIPIMNHYSGSSWCTRQRAYLNHSNSNQVHSLWNDIRVLVENFYMSDEIS